MSETEIHISQILPGSANQLIGSNAAATSNEYKTLMGTTNQIIVTNSVGTYTLSTPLTSSISYTLPSSRGSNGQVLTTDGSTAILTWTPVSAVNSGTTGQIAYYATDGNTLSGESIIPSSNGGTGLSSIGSISTELRVNSSNILYYGQNIINVKDYGAIGNGSTDDTTAIQNALNAAGDGNVYFPAGDYKISSSLQLVYGNTLLGSFGGNSGGEGTTITQSNGSVPVFLFVNTNQNAGSMEFQSITIDGFHITGGTDIFYAWNGGVGVNLRNLKCDGYSGSGLHLRGFCQQWQLDTVEFDPSSAGYGIYFAENGVHTDNVTVGTTILFDKNWFHNLLFNGGINGIHIDLLSGHTGTFNTFINTVVQATQQDGIVLKGALTNICFNGLSTEIIGVGGPTYADSTATTIAGNASVTVSSGTNFVNGQTVTIRGAGTNGADWYPIILSGGGTTTLVMTTTAPTSVTSQDITNALYAEVVLGIGTGAPATNSPIATMFQNYSSSTNGRTRYSVDCSNAIGSATFIGSSVNNPIYDPYSSASIFGQEFIQTINAQNYDGIQIFGPSFPCGSPSTAHATFLGTPLGKDLCFGLTDSSSNGTGSFGKFTFRKAATSVSIAAPELASIDSSGDMLLQGTLTPTNGIIGVSSNSSAATGIVGEYISASANNVTNTAGTGGAMIITSISLTAGDWDVSGGVRCRAGSTTSTTYTGVCEAYVGVSSSASDAQDGINLATYAFIASVSSFGSATPTTRISLSITTTIYCLGVATFTGTANQFSGGLQARRVR